MESEELKKFLRDIIKEKSQIELDTEIENQLVDDLYSRLEAVIYRDLLSGLSDEQIEALNAEDRTSEDILKFIENAGVVIQDSIAKSLISFRSMYVNS